MPCCSREVSLTTNLAASASVTGEIQVPGPAAMLRASCNLLSMPWQLLDSAWEARSISQVCSLSQTVHAQYGGLMVLLVIAGEAKDPRRTIPRAFRTIMARLLIFFVGGGLCVGVSHSCIRRELRPSR